MTQLVLSQLFQKLDVHVIENTKDHRKIASLSSLNNTKLEINFKCFIFIINRIK